MRNVFELMFRDVRHATQSVMAWMVVFGLVIIPSLFAWFNVLASWDPFANTGNLKVAVANSDAGYQSDVVPIPINVGEQVLSQLRANDDLDWIITSEEDAVDGTRSGEYYAAIVLPKSFSKDMMTFYVAGTEHTHIEYYTNEKKNALAPIITGKGADAVSAQINEVFTKTLGDVALGLISSLSDFLSEGDTQAVLANLESRLGDISGQLSANAQTADMFTALIDSSIPLIDSSAGVIAGVGDSFDQAKGAVGSGAGAVKDLKGQLGSATGALGDALGATANSYDALAGQIDDVFANLDSASGDGGATLSTVADSVQQQIDHYTDLRDSLETDVAPLVPDNLQGQFDAVVAKVDDAIARQQGLHDKLGAAADDIASGNASVQETHQGLKDSIAETKKAIEDAKASYTSDLKPKLDDLSGQLSAVGTDTKAIEQDLSGISGTLSGASGSIKGALQKAQQVTAELSDSLTDLAAKVEDVRDAAGEAADSGDLSTLTEAIGANPDVLATSLAEPVGVERTAVFPVNSFGTGMTPLYLVLSLWVGALLMTLAIRANVGKNAAVGKSVVSGKDTSAGKDGAVREDQAVYVDANAGKEGAAGKDEAVREEITKGKDTGVGGDSLSSTQKYLGRYGIFWLIGFVQATLVTLGLIFFVKVEPAHPFLLLLAAWVTSLVFTLMIYTFVVAFGNVGQALTVLLLVIQIAGSGGSYPLEVLPNWFQSISPFLPATHAVNAVRAAIAGEYGGDYLQNILLLLAFVAPVLLLGLVLRRPLISFNHSLREDLESTKLM